MNALFHFLPTTSYIISSSDYLDRYFEDVEFRATFIALFVLGQIPMQSDACPLHHSLLNGNTRSAQGTLNQRIIWLRVKVREREGGRERRERERERERERQTDRHRDSTRERE